MGEREENHSFIDHCHFKLIVSHFTWALAAQKCYHVHDHLSILHSLKISILKLFPHVSTL